MRNEDLRSQPAALKYSRSAPEADEQKTSPEWKGVWPGMMAAPFAGSGLYIVPSTFHPPVAGSISISFISAKARSGRSEWMKVNSLA